MAGLLVKGSRLYKLQLSGRRSLIAGRSIVRGEIARLSRQVGSNLTGRGGENYGRFAPREMFTAEMLPELRGRHYTGQRY